MNTRIIAWTGGLLLLGVGGVALVLMQRSTSPANLMQPGAGGAGDAFALTDADLTGLPDDFREVVLKEEDPQVRRMMARLWQLQFVQGMDAGPALDDTLLVLSEREPSRGGQSPNDFAAFAALPGLAMAWSFQGPLTSHAKMIIAEAERFAASGEMVEQHCAATLVWTLIVDPEPGRDAATTRRLQAVFAGVYKNETTAMYLKRDIAGLVEARRKAGRTGLPETLEAALPQ